MYRVLAFSLAHKSEKLIVTILEVKENDEDFPFINLMWIGEEQTSVYRANPEVVHLRWDKSKPEKSLSWLVNNGIREMLYHHFKKSTMIEHQWMFGFTPKDFSEKRWSAWRSGRQYWVGTGDFQ